MSSGNTILGDKGNQSRVVGKNISAKPAEFRHRRMAGVAS
jgi:hypothetical protein